ncbi:hypothetical protein [Hymenobacter tenuis]
MVKLGVRYGVVLTGALVPHLRYEWQLRPAWSLQVGSGYGGTSSTLGYYRQRRTTFWTTEVSAMHYLGRPQPQPLSGWFAGGGVGTVYRTVRERNTSTAAEETGSVWGLEARALFGGQAALSRRVTLQAYLAITSTYLLASYDTSSLLLSRELGASLGFRL